MGQLAAGWRSVKKQRAREAIADAALQLTLERGLGGINIDRIARQAGVSPRTVSSYFRCKEEAVVAAGNDFTGLLERFVDAPTDEPPMQVLRRELTEFLRHRTSEEMEQSRGRLQLMEENPSLVPFQVASYDNLEREFRSIVAQRSGTDVRMDMYPWLVAAAAMSAARIAMRVWDQSGADAELLPGLLTEAFDQIDTGFRPSTGHHSSGPLADGPAG